MRYIIATLVASIFLSGCTSKSNPLLNDEAVNNIHNYTFSSLSDQTFDVDCKNYLLGTSTPNESLKKRCDKRVEFIFNTFKNRESFKGATIEDMHDKQVWQRVFKSTQ